MANSIERMGVYHCGGIAEYNNWMFREQPINDVGIDAHMEFTEANGEVRQLLGLQIKTGQSWFKEKKENYIIFRDINERQYNYWVTNTLPCIIVLYNPDNNICIWEKLTVKTIERTKQGKGKGFFVKIPLNQIFLDELSNQSLLDFSELPEHITNYNFLLSQKSFMQIIQDGGTIRLHSNEWINKCSGIGSIELIVNDEKGESKYSYPYRFHILRILKFFLNCFHGQTLLLIKIFIKMKMKIYGMKKIVIMIKKTTSGLFWGTALKSFVKG